MAAYLEEALARLDAAGGAARLTRPDPAQAALRAQLGEVELLLRRALDEAGTAEARVRDRFSALLEGARLVPREHLERVRTALRRRGPLGDVVVDAAEQIGDACARVFYGCPPETLSVPIRAHVDRVTALTALSMGPATRTRVNRLLSDVAAFAGWLAYDLGQAGAARAYFGLAGSAAREAGDATLNALAVGSTGQSHSIFLSGANEGDPRRALWLLVQARRTLPADAPPRVHAWLSVLAARESAVTGDADNAARLLDLAEEARAERGPQAPDCGFFADHGWFALLDDPWWFTFNQGRTLARLGDERGEQALLQVAGATSDPRQRGCALLDVMDLRVTAGEYEGAAALGLEVVNSAITSGLARQVGRVRTIRDRAPDHAAAAFRDLDDLVGA